MHYFTDFCGNISKFQMADLALKCKKDCRIRGAPGGVTTSEEKAMPAAAVTPLTDEEVKATEAYLIIFTQFTTPKGIQVEVGKESPLRR